MTSRSSDHSVGPLPAEDEGPPTPTDAVRAREERDEGAATKPPPPPRRQTMEVQMGWLDLQPRIERVPTSMPDEAPTKTKSVSPISDALQSDSGDIADAFPEHDAPTVPRRWPPRLPGSARSLPPMPVGSTKPPAPPRRMTTEVSMEWVELVDDDLVEEPPSVPTLPKLHDEIDERAEKEVTRLETASASLERIEKEKAAVFAERQAQLEGPPISDAMRAARAEEAAKQEAMKELLSEFLHAVSGSAPPGPHRVSEHPPASSDADHDLMREAALADRKREQDARDREILARRRAERKRERLEEEARRARREQERREEEERLAAAKQGNPEGQPLDLSRSEIDNALDAALGSHLSYPPPPPSDDDEE